MICTLTRSKRKTCAIIIRDHVVEVRAPMRMPESDINRFVDAKTDWIKAKLAEAAVYAEKRSAFSLTYGGTVRYRGQEIPIIPKPGNRIGLCEDGFYMPPGLPPESIKSACVQVYRLCAKPVLTEKVLTFSKVMDVSQEMIKINGAKTRWGSCSAKKNLNFSWRLMMAADPVIDYVVVHELAHLKEMNHSARFWAVVERVIPAYKGFQKELRLLQNQLHMEDWEI